MPNHPPTTSPTPGCHKERRIKRLALRFAERATATIRAVSPLPPSPRKRTPSPRKRAPSISPRKPAPRRFKTYHAAPKKIQYRVEPIPLPARDYSTVNRSRVHPADPRLQIIQAAYQQRSRQRELRALADVPSRNSSRHTTTSPKVTSANPHRTERTIPRRLISVHR